MRIVFFSAVSLVSSLLLPAQDATFTSPQGGYVFDRYSHAIRPVVGVPGAAYLGGGIGEGLDSAWPAPASTVALAVRQGQTVLYKNLASQPAAMETPSALLPAATNASWSSNGSFAILYSAGTHQLQRLSFHQGAASIDTPIDASRFGQVTALAIDNQGTIALAAPHPDHPRGRRTNSGTMIYQIRADGTASQLASTPGAVILGAGPAGSYYVDLKAGILYAMPQSGASSQPLSNGWQGAAGLAASADGRNLYIASTDGHRVSVYDLKTNTVTGDIPVSQAITGLRPLTSSTFVLGGFTSAAEPLYVLDVRVSPPAVYFVPTAASSSL